MFVVGSRMRDGRVDLDRDGAPAVRRGDSDHHRVLLLRVPMRDARAPAPMGAVRVVLAGGRMDRRRVRDHQQGGPPHAVGAGQGDGVAAGAARLSRVLPRALALLSLGEAGDARRAVAVAERRGGAGGSRRRRRSARSRAGTCCRCCSRRCSSSASSRCSRPTCGARARAITRASTEAGRRAGREAERTTERARSRTIDGRRGDRRADEGAGEGGEEHGRATCGRSCSSFSSIALRSARCSARIC